MTSERRPAALGQSRTSTPAAALPDSVRLSLWVSAWLAGEASLDEARDAVVGEDAAHDVGGLLDEPLPLILALGRLRQAGATSADLALPVPGDPLGLGGPPAFNAEALEAEEAVLLPGAGLGLVPARTGAGVVWRCLPAQPSRVPADPGEADRDLRRTLPATADALADLDVARWRPEVADELLDLRRPRRLPVPPALDPKRVAMLTTALTCTRIVELALADDGAAVTAFEAERRRQLLTPLDRAARRALVAACTAAFV